ncbi:hypothetical protein [Clostridium saccharoperbutylacetonicum]|uniref:hypothetical protein n=1 Tax=Clostridium saccharoperbutylacetonicum TaxID=36745 RepID=UPI000983D739|nr:hypothetical protein [Clostridium saccharoperbutylacetonicum]AQR94032.1 hypothetical protein CLSAP_13390 [Clostridium saccharoperbutylacetonicum]NSB29731.1 hypothetical protein [Clostridium saccharoperbutylacetonicum]
MNNKSYLTKVWNVISSTIFSNSEYEYEKYSRLHDNFNRIDTTELRLISSRRTFI